MSNKTLPYHMFHFANFFLPKKDITFDLAEIERNKIDFAVIKFYCAFNAVIKNVNIVKKSIKPNYPKMYNFFRKKKYIFKFWMLFPSF